jgi:hypothetical protein
MSKNENWKLHFEALKLLKEWSTALVVIQTGAMAVLGGLLKNGSVGEAKIWLAISLACFLASILVAANVIGAIPPIVQKLPELVPKYGDIYKMRNFLGIPVWVLAFGEHLFFAGGLITFGGFIYFWAK